MTQARKNSWVSVTRAKTRTTIMSPKSDVYVLLIPSNRAECRVLVIWLQQLPSSFMDWNRERTAPSGKQV